MLKKENQNTIVVYHMIFNQYTKAAEKVWDVSKLNTMVLKLELDALLKVLADYKPTSMWRDYDFCVH